MPESSGHILQTMRRGGISRSLLALFIALALLVRAFIPAGYMPDMKALQDGVFRITICTASGSDIITVDRNNQPVSADDASGSANGAAPSMKGGSSFCAFGSLPQIALLALAFFLLFGTARKRPPSGLQRAQLFIPRHGLSLAQPRGPPATC